MKYAAEMPDVIKINQYVEILDIQLPNSYHKKVSPAYDTELLF